MMSRFNFVEMDSNTPRYASDQEICDSCGTRDRLLNYRVPQRSTSQYVLRDLAGSK